MASKLEIYNMAISLIRGQRIGSLTQNSPERRECERWFEIVAKVAMEAAFWNCCKDATKLGNRSNAVTRDFEYVYPLPTNYLRAWYTKDFSRFSIEGDNGTLKLFSDQQSVTLFYSEYISDTSKWPNELTMSVVHSLAARIGEQFPSNKVDTAALLGIGESYLQRGQTTSLNSMGMNLMYDSDPDWITARGSGLRAPIRYYHPFGQGFISGV